MKPLSLMQPLGSSLGFRLHDILLAIEKIQAPDTKTFPQISEDSIRQWAQATIKSEI